MLAQARFEPPEGTTLRLLQSDVLSWEPDREYDVVTCFGAFGHIVEADQPRFLALVHRALRPGGRFVFVTAPHPSPLRLGFWASHAFNLVMRVRNALVPPPFVMYYLTFLIPEALDRCKEAGLEPVVTPLHWKDHPRIVLVEAYRRA
jgi:SAM-dependent methyltransferase